MSWISEQKPKGKFYGLIVGSFLAHGWGHWHDRIMSYFRVHWNKRFTQLAMVGVTLFYIILGSSDIRGLFIQWKKARC
jgi:hypothetical protein